MSVASAERVARGSRSPAALVLTLVAAVGLLIGLDRLWFSEAVQDTAARLAGDPRIRLAPGVTLSGSPGQAPVYELSGHVVRPEELRTAMGGGTVRQVGDWLEWTGVCDRSGLQVMTALQPGIEWQQQQAYVWPSSGVPSVPGVRGRFPGADANAYAMFFAENGQTVRASVPVTTLEPVGSVAIMSAAQAFDDLVHHRPGASLTVASPQWLPSRLLEPQPGTDPVRDVGLVQIPDPQDPSRSVPAWAFGQVGRVLAAR